MKKSIKRGLAALLAALLIMPTNVLPASAAEASAGVASAVNQTAAEVTYNPGAGYFTVYDWNTVSGNDALLEGIGFDVTDEDDMAYFQECFCFDENGAYTIQVEPDAFFPYEVEFTVDGVKTRQWFDTPDSTVEVGDHVFSIFSETTGEQITGLTLNVAGNQIVVRPEKEFVDEPLSLVSTMSLLPLEEKRFRTIDLSGYTPIELTQVSLSGLLDGETVSAEKFAWKYDASGDNGSYEINGTSEKVDLSWGTSSGSVVRLYVIDNNGEQLDGNATRYILPIQLASCRQWLQPTVYKKAADGSKIDLSTYNQYYEDSISYRWNGNDRRFLISLDSEAVTSSDQIYVKLNVKDTVFPNVNFATLKAFDGEDKSIEITEQLITVGTEGYATSLSQENHIILEAYDTAGQVVGTLPMYFKLSSTNVNRGLSEIGLYNASGSRCYEISSGTINNTTQVKTITYKLRSGNSQEQTYYWRVSYLDYNVVDNSKVTAAYVGLYDSIAKASESGAADIKDTLFGSEGYGANYSGDGVSFTIFVGADGTEGQKIYKRTVKVITVADLQEIGLFDASGNYCYVNSNTDTDKATQVKTIIYEPNDGKRANEIYYWRAKYLEDNVLDNSKVTAAYIGFYDSILEASAAGATDIKDTLFGTQGYGADYSGDGVSFTIFVGADGTEGQKIYKRTVKVLTVTDVRQKGLNYASGSRCYESRSEAIDNTTQVKTITYELYSGERANETYYWGAKYIEYNVVNNSKVTAAYVGFYDSILEASAAGATDIKDTLFGTKGYGADYSGDGVSFTIFVGADGTEGQKVYKFIIKCKDTLASGADWTLSTILDENGNIVHTTRGNDSYGESNYFTYYVDKEVDLTKLKMYFSLSTGAKLYAGNQEVKSEETLLDFSKGAIQFTTASQDGKNSKNYWVAVYKPIEGAGQLYINSLQDEAAKTEVKDGVVYSTREVMLDSYHNNIHDIMVANLGTQPIANLKAELSADATVALDGYWQLSGQHSLEGFSDSYGYVKSEEGSFTSGTTSYGMLWNLAKVRLVKKADVEDGTDVTGTLTFKTGDTILMVLTLTGTVGDPTITTKEIPAAVKYVPYGVMIQNSNKYSWNKVTYKLTEGKLPKGMRLKDNGELYGVPTQTGEFTFKVCMVNSSDRFSNRYKEFTLIVAENTDENVESATDEGYTVLDRIPDINLDAEGSYSIRSEGALATFQDIYLDGVKLEEGTDYTKSEGSTRVTISSQTLTSSKEAGTHTLGMEFRENATGASEGTLKRAAQNYQLKEKAEDNNNSGSSDNSGSNNNSGSSDNSGSNNNSGSSDNSGNNNNSGSSDNSGSNNNSGSSDNSGSNNNSGNSDNSGSNSNSGSNDDSDSNDTSSDDGNSSASVTPNTTASVAAPQYTVVKGDTLSKIAARNNMTLAALLKLNPQIKNPNLIRVGQVIHLGNGTVTTVTVPVNSQEAVGYYTIVKGDCLSRIAAKHKISLANLLAMNPQIAGQKYIFPGQQIKVK